MVAGLTVLPHRMLTTELRSGEGVLAYFDQVSPFTTEWQASWAHRLVVRPDDPLTRSPAFHGIFERVIHDRGIDDVPVARILVLSSTRERCDRP